MMSTKKGDRGRIDDGLRPVGGRLSPERSVGAKGVSTVVEWVFKLPIRYMFTAESA